MKKKTTTKRRRKKSMLGKENISFSLFSQSVRSTYLVCHLSVIFPQESKAFENILLKRIGRFCEL